MNGSSLPLLIISLVLAAANVAGAITTIRKLFSNSRQNYFATFFLTKITISTKNEDEDNIILRYRFHIAVINGLRGWAILGILWNSLFGLYFKAGSVIALPSATGPAGFLSYGWTGVQLFFLLSGFVLYLPYVDGRAKLNTQADLWHFYRHRAARLLPLYYIVAAICVALNQPPPDGPKFAAELASIALVMFPFVVHGFQPYFNPPLWSLGVEIWFSVLFPLVILALQRFGAARLLLATVVLGCASRTLGLMLTPGAPILPLTTGLTASLEIFGVGMVLAQWYAGGHRLVWPRLGTTGGAVLVFAAIWAKQALLPGMQVLFVDVLTIGLVLIVAGLLSLETGLLRAAFANRPIQLLGMMSFSLYVWHEPLLRHIFQADIAPLEDLAYRLPVYVTLLVAIGVLSFRFIEFGKISDARALFLLSGAKAHDRKRGAARKLFETGGTDSAP